jgi:uncharacterized coiled-coil protein SlyX
MLLTIRDVPDDLVERAKVATGKKTGSQAFIAGIDLMLHLAERTAEHRAEIERLRNIVARQQQVLDQARDAAALLVEACGQGDMFMSKEKRNG